MIHSDRKPVNDPGLEAKDLEISNIGLPREVSFSDQLAPIEEESPTPAFAMKKMTERRHVETDYEIMRGIPLHRALRQSELWTSPHEIRRRNRSAQVWELSRGVSEFDTFLSHTWQTKGRWKVLALMMQTGWLHALFAWFVGVAVMLCLRAFDIVGVPWENVQVVISTGERIGVSCTPWTVISGGVSLVIGLCLSPYLPFKTQMCFLDVACIHQGQDDMFERGLYSIGGCLAVAKELRVLYSPGYLSSLWCLFELVGFRKANPDGKLTMSALFVERSAAICVFMVWCAVLSINIFLALTDVKYQQTNDVVVLVATFLLPNILIVHAMRYNYREKNRLISELKTFDIDQLHCASNFDRIFILTAVDAWYGSREDFRDFVRTSLREELLGLLPSPHLPSAYAAMTLSSPVAWILDTTLDTYKAGVDGHYTLRRCLAFFGFALWFWFALNGTFYLSDISAPRGRTRLLDWAKTLVVAGTIFGWILSSFALLQAVSRSTSMLVLVSYLAFSMLLPVFILDGFGICRRRCQKRR